MQGNSNFIQASQIKSKRENFRKEIRKEKIDMRFTKIRQDLLVSFQNDKTNKRFLQIFHRIKKVQPNDYQQLHQACLQVQQIAKQFPFQKASYTLIGNCIIYDPQNIYLFKDQILHDKILENQTSQSTQTDYLWSLCVYIKSFIQLIKCQAPKMQQQNDIFTKIDWIIGQFLYKYSSSNCKLEIKVQQFQYLLIAAKYIMNLRWKPFFQCLIATSICENLGQIHKLTKDQNITLVGCLKNEINSIVFQIKNVVKDLYNNEESCKEEIDNTYLTFAQRYPSSSQIMGMFIKNASPILLENIKMSTQNRREAIECIHFLNRIYSLECLDYFLTKQMIDQLLYLMININKPEFILKIIYESMNIGPKDYIMTLLNCGAHINFVQCLRSGLQISYGNNYNSQMVQASLKSIVCILQKVSDFDDKKLLNTVLNQMQDNQLYQILQRMALKRYNQSIQVVLNEILCDYYSEQEPDNQWIEKQMMDKE